MKVRFAQMSRRDILQAGGRRSAVVEIQVIVPADRGYHAAATVLDAGGCQARHIWQRVDQGGARDWHVAGG